jgi:hypothetical protein
MADSGALVEKGFADYNSGPTPASRTSSSKEFAFIFSITRAMGFDGLLDDKQVARDLTPLLASVGPGAYALDVRRLHDDHRDSAELLVRHDVLGHGHDGG